MYKIRLPTKEIINGIIVINYIFQFITYRLNFYYYFY